MRAMIEGIGSPTWGPLLPLLRAECEWITGTDIDPLAWGLYEVDDGQLVPGYDDTEAWEALLSLCTKAGTDTVIPSIDEGMLLWGSQRDALAMRGVALIQSSSTVLSICSDKWRTYQYFLDLGIPTPPTSTEAEYPLVKPRRGRGGAGVRLVSPGERVDMTGMVSQQFLRGREYSIDAFCRPDGSAACVVVRERLAVESGISVRGRTVRDREIETLARRLISSGGYFGPVNFQCFRTAEGVFFTEINPRIAGGMSLSMAATGNWFGWIRAHLEGREIPDVETRVGVVMMRTFRDTIVSETSLLEFIH